ncbi:1578_t:CDS:2 [Gigaspora rosea]|nr:1578_t:CDS:2 [Gigaspora rosea]
MSGFDVSRAIRAMRPPVSNITIFILTNLLTEEIQIKCIELEINDFLGKPLKIKELEKTQPRLRLLPAVPPFNRSLNLYQEFHLLWEF